MSDWHTSRSSEAKDGHIFLSWQTDVMDWELPGRSAGVSICRSSNVLAPCSTIFKTSGLTLATSRCSISVQGVLSYLLASYNFP